MATARDEFTGAIGRAIQGEVDKIYDILQRHTDAFTGLAVRPEFSWEKAISFEILGRDGHGVEASLDRRGSGMRRLLMVAFFQYLVEKDRVKGKNFIFTVEEPENCLHPSLQREFARSFQILVERGDQIIITTHSPVFVGASPVEDLALVTREKGVAQTQQGEGLELSKVAEELGVEPSDQITGYCACVFVEGPDDAFFWSTVAAKLKSEEHIKADFADLNIGFVIYGGDNLKHWVDRRALRRLTRRFAVIVDSDRESPSHNIPGKKLNWQSQCEADGGLFFITQKREIENYIHPEAINRSKELTLQHYDEFTDMKALFGPAICKQIENMSCEEILEMGRYTKDGAEHNELKEIVEAILSLVDA